MIHDSSERSHSAHMFKETEASEFSNKPPSCEHAGTNGSLGTGTREPFFNRGGQGQKSPDRHKRGIFLTPISNFRGQLTPWSGLPVPLFRYVSGTNYQEHQLVLIWKSDSGYVLSSGSSCNRQRWILVSQKANIILELCNYSILHLRQTLQHVTLMNSHSIMQVTTSSVSCWN